MTPKQWVNTSLGALSLIVCLILHQIYLLVWDSLSLPMYNDWILSLPLIVAIASGGILYGVLSANKQIQEYSTEVVNEMSKVVYPLKKETLISAVVVLIMVTIAALILFLFDTIWGTATQKLLMG